MKVDSKKFKDNLAAAGLAFAAELLQKVGAWGVSKLSETLDKKKNSIKNSGTESSSQNSQESDKAKT